MGKEFLKVLQLIKEFRSNDLNDRNNASTSLQPIDRKKILHQLLVFAEDKSENANVREEAIRMLYFFINEPVENNSTVLQSLIAVAQDKTEVSKVRQQAVRILGNCLYEQAVEPLIELLADPTFKGGDVVFALGKIKDGRAFIPLIQCLADEKLKYFAITALGEIGDKQAIEPLFALLDIYDDYISRFNLVRSLARLGDKRVVKDLIGFLHNQEEEYEYRYQAATALGKLGDMAAVVPLIEALKDPHYIVRDNSAYALGLLGDTRAIEPLIELLLDLESTVRMNAALALGEIGERRVVGVLKQALEFEKSFQDADFDITVTIMGALYQLGETQYFEILRELLDSPSEDMCIDALRALSKVENKSVTDIARQKISDKNLSMRCIAIEILGNYGYTPDLALLMPLLKSRPRDLISMRDIIQEALAAINQRAIN